MTEQPLICVIDDDEGVRQSLDTLVRSLGYRVALFESAESFLASAVAADSSCVISDVQMPGGMGGIELVRRVCASDLTVPVILISAFANDDVRSEAQLAGAHCFLKKPYTGDDLIECLYRALAG